MIPGALLTAAALTGEATDVTAPSPGGHDWLLGTVLVALIGGAATVVGVWLTGRRGRHRVQRILHQTENEHEDSEYPNLREQLDAMHAEQREGIARLEAGQKRHDSEIGGLRREIGHDREETRKVADRLEGHVEETRREHTALVRRLDIHLVQSTEDREELREIADRIDRHHPEP